MSDDEPITGDSEENWGTETKYTIPDEFWEEDVEEENNAHPTTYIKSHTVDVYVDDEPDPDDNYGRTQYTAHISYDDGKPVVLYFTTHRWKGNYWRDKMDLDWKDAPETVKTEVASVVICDSVESLSPEVRLIEEGGRNRWREIHEPRIQNSTSNVETRDS